MGTPFPIASAKVRRLYDMAMDFDHFFTVRREKRWVSDAKKVNREKTEGKTGAFWRKQEEMRRGMEGDVYI